MQLEKNKMKKVVFIFGTRPEAIKMAPLINIFKKRKDKFKSIVIVTAQHRQMLDQVLKLFNIVPDFDLNIMKPNQNLHELTSKILKELSVLLIKIRPDIIFVQGDTTTTFASSLAAFYEKIPVAHIEAGLRTKNKYSPFPEEINRRMTTSIASYHFPPTKNSEDNLLNEGIDSKNIVVSGNTVIDSLLIASNNLDKNKINEETLFKSKYNIDLSSKKIILITGHRRENFGKKFENICHAIKEIVLKNDVMVIYPVHLNPNVQKPVNFFLEGIKNIFLIPPQDYLPFIFLMKKSYLILTDSGGVQEEAPSLGKPVLVMRDTTERMEGVFSGTAELVGTETKKIITSVEKLLRDKIEYNKMAKSVNPYGNGDSSKIIYNFIDKIFYK